MSPKDIDNLIVYRCNEISCFLNYLNQYYDVKMEYVKFELFKSLPFRNSTSIFTEKEIIEKHYNVKFNSYYEMIKYIADLCQIEAGHLKDFIDDNNIGFSSFGKDKRLVTNKCNKTIGENEIVNKFYESYAYPNTDLSKFVLQRKAEMIINDYLKTNNNLNITWATDVVGEGFGYSFVVHDTTNNNFNFYTVINAIGDGKDIFLTKEEQQAFKRIEENEYINEHYHILVVNYYKEIDGNIRYGIIDLSKNNNKLSFNSIYGQQYDIKCSEADIYSGLAYTRKK